MAQSQVIGVLSNKRAEPAATAMLIQQQLVQHRTNLGISDATMRLFESEIQPKEIRAELQRARSAWFGRASVLADP